VNPCELNFSERVNWLRLARTPGIGSVNFAKLLGRYETSEAAIDALPELALQRRGRKFSIPSRDTIEGELEAIERAGARLLASCEPDFPLLLACTNAPPPTLIVKGRLDLVSKTTSAIVGARNASAAGLRFARELANGLGEADVTIVSGLARGIDWKPERSRWSPVESITFIRASIWDYINRSRRTASWFLRCRWGQPRPRATFPDETG
jgi:DNA processing protein